MKQSQVKQRQALPLRQKITLSLRRIKEFNTHYDNNTYVSFSGGKDSTVLLHLVRSLYPNTKAVFFNTGLEFPEIVEFVKSTPNTIMIRPHMTFKQVLDHYGYPVVSKEVSKKIREYRNTKSEKQKQKLLYGKVGYIPNKWKFLINADIKISDRCCYVMKKRPADLYERETNTHPYIGSLAEESQLRLTQYIRNGCNSYTKRPRSLPLSFWTEKDIWQYIRDNNLEYSTIYDKGYKRTGCIFCMFGLQYDPNRFNRLKLIHPKLYDYCMNTLDLKRVIDIVNKCDKDIF